MTINRLKININNSLLKFLTVGVINTLLSLLVIFGLKYFYLMSDFYANLIGYIVGLICSFVLNRKWTFNHSGDLFNTILKFLLVFILAYSANIIFVLALIKINVNSYFSHIMGIPLYTIIFYLGSKFVVFKSNS
jgi:putative flippase GtrA